MMLKKWSGSKLQLGEVRNPYTPGGKCVIMSMYCCLSKEQEPRIQETLFVGNIPLSICHVRALIAPLSMFSRKQKGSMEPDWGGSWVEKNPKPTLWLLVGVFGLVLRAWTEVTEARIPLGDQKVGWLSWGSCHSSLLRMSK